MKKYRKIGRWMDEHYTISTAIMARRDVSCNLCAHRFRVEHRNALTAMSKVRSGVLAHLREAHPDIATETM